MAGEAQFNPEHTHRILTELLFPQYESGRLCSSKDILMIFVNGIPSTPTETELTLFRLKVYMFIGMLRAARVPEADMLEYDGGFVANLKRILGYIIPGECDLEDTTLTQSQLASSRRARDFPELNLIKGASFP